MPAKKSKKSTSRIEKTSFGEQSFFEKIQTDLEKNNSFINIVLGSLIVIVLGVLVFNYFNKPSSDLGPSQQTENETGKPGEDVAKENLPGKYTVKEGDTLFAIAQRYYDDGYKYDKIMQANKIQDGNLISAGQVLEIPKLASEQASLEENPAASQSPEPNTTGYVEGAQGGAENQTVWGEKISSESYTVQTGDWLSKIAGRAYGDIYQYEKIAQANNIQDPNKIEIGTVLKIPR